MHSYHIIDIDWFESWKIVHIVFNLLTIWFVLRSVLMSLIKGWRGWNQLPNEFTSNHDDHHVNTWFEYILLHDSSICFRNAEKKKRHKNLFDFVAYRICCRMSSLLLLLLLLINSVSYCAECRNLLTKEFMWYYTICHKKSAIYFLKGSKHIKKSNKCFMLEECSFWLTYRVIQCKMFSRTKNKTKTVVQNSV